MAAARPALAGLQWHPDGGRLTYVRRARELRAFDIRSARERVVLTLEHGHPATLRDYRWCPGGRRILVNSGNDLYLVEKGRAPRRLTHDDDTEEFPSFSPDGKRVAYIRSGDLHVYDLGQNREWALTKRLSTDVLNGRVDGVYEEELAARAGQAYVWSPDGNAIAYLQTDQASVPRRTIVDPLRPEAPATLQRFPAPRDPNPVARLGLVFLGADGRPRRELLWPLRDAEYLLPQLTWSRDSRRVLFQTLTRRQDRLELRALDVARALSESRTAERTVLAETDAAWVNAIAAPLMLNDGRNFLWLSERSGPRHLYRCALDDGTCRALTGGDGSIDRLIGADERRGLAYLLAAFPSARERQLHAVPLAGGLPRRLTPESGTHDVSLAPDGAAFVDVFSTAAAPPQTHVVTLPALRRQTIDPGAPATAVPSEAEWVDVRAADGTTLHGRLARPAGATQGPPRPAVVLAYGGPRGQLVRDVWAADWSSGLERLLVAAGYVVWTLDNRGTAGRGRGFESALHGELGRTELADQLAGVEYLRKLRYVDGQRLGICGISYGGYLALYAAVHAPEVFRAVAAGAPVTDWRCYDSIYTERYLGLPNENGAGYASSAILGKAASVRAPLLLFHGTADANVHIDHTALLVEELKAAGRTPAVELHAGEGHTYRSPAAKIARDKAILAFFAAHLHAGDEPTAAGPNP